jgi:Predicted membrane protein (DUF2079)
MLFGAALVLLFAGIMAVKFALWHANALMSDWPYYNNIFWNTNFRDLWLYNNDRHIQFGYPSYLNEHFAPLLLVLAALYQWVPYPGALLLLIQGASPVLAAIFIYATALRLLGERRLAAAIALSFALNPGILWPTISLVHGFEPDSMLPPLAAAVGWALATNRIGVYCVALALALGIKENVPAYGVILGACMFVFTKRRRLGMITFLVSLAMFVVASKGVATITGVQNRNIGVAWHFIDSLLHMRATFDYTRVEILIGLAYSTAFLPALFMAPFLVVIVPDLLLIGQVAHANLVTWHVMLPVTVLGVASVYGTARILRTRFWPAALDKRVARLPLMRRYWTTVLAVSLIAGPLTIGAAYHRYIALRTAVDRTAVAQARALIPADAGLATTSDLEQYFAHRRIVSSRPEVIEKAAAEFTFAALNRRALTESRRDGIGAVSYLRDRCLIDAAERALRNGGRSLLDRGGILVVQFARMPKLDCLSAAGAPAVR